MAIRKMKFKMTAKIVQYHVVEINEDDIPEGQDPLEYGQQKANETWDYTQSSDEERFSQDAEYLDEVG